MVLAGILFAGTDGVVGTRGGLYVVAGKRGGAMSRVFMDARWTGGRGRLRVGADARWHGAGGNWTGWLASV